MVQSTTRSDVGTNGSIGVRITQMRQDWEDNTSRVKVEGLLKNKSGGRVVHDRSNIDRRITGDQTFHHPNDFDIVLNGGQEMVFISHVFTLKHDDGGHRTANFGVKIGDTNMTMFPDNSSVSGSLDLTQIPQFWQEVSSTGEISIKIIQVGQDWSKNTSTVRVEGLLHNKGNTASKHLATNIGRWISGDGNYHPDGFSINLDPGEQMTFISRTFTIKHDADGTKTVSFTVKYGNTDLARFPDGESINRTKELDRIPLRPGKPTTPEFSNEAPTKVTVTWSDPDDDGGDAINNYILRRYIGTSPTGSHIDSSSQGHVRNITDLDPGVTYTFTVVAYNDSKDHDGASPPSDPATITTVAGVWIRDGGKWKKAIPYVRTGGDWVQALPYVRSGGTWKRTS